jgi:hypothetical protein
MKRLGIFVIFSLLLAAATFAAPVDPALKVKVMVAMANVRSGPAPDAAVVMTVESGRVFDVIDKVGDWYLVALPENKQGYLSSAVVAEVAEGGKPAAPVQAPVSAPPAPQRPVDRPAPQAYNPGGTTSGKMEINLLGGYGMTSVKGASNYMDTWSYQYLSSVSESTDITGTSKGGMFFGGSFSYFFSPNLGIQLSGGYLKSDVPTTANFSFSYKWTTSSTVYNESKSFAGTGSLSVMPISLNLVGRFGDGALKIYVSAGPTMFLNSFQADSTVGYGVSTYYIIYPYAYQNVDALGLPVDIPKTSWSGFGFNAGADACYMFSPSIGFAVGARYFFCAPKELPWTTMTGGTYNGIFYTSITGVQYTQAMATNILDVITTFKVNPSFFQITAGIKIVI